MLNLEKIGLRLKLLRVEKKLTQAQLAKDIGCPAHKVSLWETGRVLISTRYLHKVSNYFGVPGDYIMTGANFPELAKN